MDRATRPILPRLREAMSTRAFWLHAWRAAMLFGLLACATTIARAGDWGNGGMQAVAGAVVFGQPTPRNFPVCGHGRSHAESIATATMTGHGWPITAMTPQ